MSANRILGELRQPCDGEQSATLDRHQEFLCQGPFGVALREPVSAKPQRAEDVHAWKRTIVELNNLTRERSASRVGAPTPKDLAEVQLEVVNQRHLATVTGRALANPLATDEALRLRAAPVRGPGGTTGKHIGLSARVAIVVRAAARAGRRRLTLPAASGGARGDAGLNGWCDGRLRCAAWCHWRVGTRPGDHEGAWEEIRRSGPLLSAAQADVDAVAAATMRRALPQLERIAEQVAALGFTPGIDAIPILDPPGDDAPARVADLVGAIGPLPAAMVAQMSVIGGVSLVGDSSALGLSYADTASAPRRGMPPGADYPDPLWLPSAQTLASDWEDWPADPDRRAEPFTFAFAPDELHKANISGGTHDVGLPDPSADPVLHGVAGRPGITLVEYLRVSVAWGGLPGYSFDPQRMPPALSRLRAQPRF